MLDEFLYGVMADSCIRDLWFRIHICGWFSQQVPSSVVSKCCLRPFCPEFNTPRVHELLKKKKRKKKKKEQMKSRLVQCGSVSFEGVYSISRGTSIVGDN